ncbi:MAG: UrcA family protein, partial [Steroidobacteraceae bacterium]|nr:UrcA family protein [Steroidobacteraceae bacterium]
MKNLIFSAAAIAALACSATVFADFGDNVAVHKVYVHYSDLNANSAQGAEALYARLKSAAKTACGTDPGRSLDAIVDFRQCRSDALSKAVTDVG